MRNAGRRAVLQATAITGLTALALGTTIGKEENESTRSDRDLISACTALADIYLVIRAADKISGVSDEQNAAIGDRWDAAVDRVLRAPPPMTNAGRLALLRATRVGLFQRALDDGFSWGKMELEDRLALHVLQVMGA